MGSLNGVAFFFFSLSSFLPFSFSSGKGIPIPEIKIINNNLDFKMGSCVTFLKSGVKKGFCYVFSIWAHMLRLKAFLDGANGKESACQFRRHESDPWVRKSP